MEVPMDIDIKDIPLPGETIKDVIDHTKPAELSNSENQDIPNKVVPVESDTSVPESAVKEKCGCDERSTEDISMPNTDNSSEEVHQTIVETECGDVPESNETVEIHEKNVTECENDNDESNVNQAKDDEPFKNNTEENNKLVVDDSIENVSTVDNVDTSVTKILGEKLKISECSSSKPKLTKETSKKNMSESTCSESKNETEDILLRSEDETSKISETNDSTKISETEDSFTLVLEVSDSDETEKDLAQYHGKRDTNNDECKIKEEVDIEGEANQETEKDISEEIDDGMREIEEDLCNQDYIVEKGSPHRNITDVSENNSTNLDTEDLRRTENENKILVTGMPETANVEKMSVTQEQKLEDKIKSVKTVYTGHEISEQNIVPHEEIVSFNSNLQNASFGNNVEKNRTKQNIQIVAIENVQHVTVESEMGFITPDNNIVNVNFESNTEYLSIQSNKHELVPGKKIKGEDNIQNVLLESKVQEKFTMKTQDDNITQKLSTDVITEKGLTKSETNELVQNPPTVSTDSTDKLQSSTSQKISTEKTLSAENVQKVDKLSDTNTQKASTGNKSQSAKFKPKIEKPVLPIPNIPCHVLGRNVDNPQEDLVSNGRTPPKPRLGVKVPYRHLRSQIVTKQDIANELFERSAKRNPDPDLPLGGDIFFVKKLTQHLASKIAMKETKKLEEKKTEKNINVEKRHSLVLGTDVPSVPISTSHDPSKSKMQAISNNSDLLAILEGDIEVDWTKDIQKKHDFPKQKMISEAVDISPPILTPENIESINICAGNTPPKLELPVSDQNSTVSKKIMDPNLKREIALKQLEEYPKRALRGRNRKQNLHEQVQGRRNLTKEIEVPVEQLITIKEDAAHTASTILEPSNAVKDITTAVLEVVKEKKELSLKDAENIVTSTPVVKKKLLKVSKEIQNVKEIQPNFNVNDVEPILSPKKVTKTYSRKEALLEVPEELVQFVEKDVTITATENKDIPTDKVSEENQDKKEPVKKDAKDSKKEKDIKDVENTGKTVETKEKVKKPKKQKRVMADRDINKPEVTLVSKRARIIKKKVIWDPAEVQTRTPARSVKKYTDENNVKTSVSKAKSTVSSAKTSNQNLQKTEKDDKKIIKKSEKETKEVDEKTGKVSNKVTRPEAKIAKILTKARVLRLRKGGNRLLLKKKGKKGTISKSSNGEIRKSLAVIKKNKQKIITKKSKSKMTELDRLLMDEGAVNMLFSVKQDNKTKKTSISIDRAQKDLKTRIKAVKDVITLNSSQEDTPIALRKKEGPRQIIFLRSPLRKKSRDSIRSSLQSPPPSPSYMYATRAEASRIIRRHSSSFSSECSTPRRMSMDQNAEKTESKPDVVEDKKEITENNIVSKKKKSVTIFVRKRDEKLQKDKIKEKTDSEKKDPQKESKIHPEKQIEAKKTEQTLQIVKEKLSTAEKRKLSNEMSKNFSKEKPRKRTRSSKIEDSEKKNIVNTVKSPTKSMPPRSAKKTGSYLESTKSKEVKMSENDKLRVSNRIIAMTNNNYKEISVRKMDNLVQIILTPTTTKIKNAVNLQMFKELCEILSKLSKDDTCRVVLVSSADHYFCHGIDFSALIQSNADRRLARAQEMAKAVREFFHTLAFFPKPLVAGIHGPTVGLGVTMLPLFDVVLASDKATFVTPYGRLGHVPEGGIFLASPHIRGSILTSELLYACRKLTASEALQHGLVTRVLWPDKFHEELIPIVKTIAKQSSQCMVATKQLLRSSFLSNLKSTLEEESKMLIEHWTSPECQQNFKKLLQENEWS